MNLLFQDRENASRRAVAGPTCADTRPCDADTVAITYATCSVMLATISKGPSGARSGSQTYSPGFSVMVSGETSTPSVKISAETIECPKISKFVTRALNKENEVFMIADE